MPLHAFENKEYGITATIYRHAKGFSVALRDDDAGETVQAWIVYPTEELAIKKAKELVA